MKEFIHRSLTQLRQLGFFKAEDNNGSSALPIGRAALASLITLLAVYTLMERFVSLLPNVWAQLALYSVLPLAVAFRILYHSHWHEEQTTPKRCGSVAFMSLVALSSALFFAGMMVTIAAFLAVACRMCAGAR